MKDLATSGGAPHLPMAVQEDVLADALLAPLETLEPLGRPAGEWRNVLAPCPSDPEVATTGPHAWHAWPQLRGCAAWRACMEVHAWKCERAVRVYGGTYGA